MGRHAWQEACSSSCRRPTVRATSPAPDLEHAGRGRVLRWPAPTSGSRSSSGRSRPISRRTTSSGRRTLPLDLVAEATGQGGKPRSRRLAPARRTAARGHRESYVHGYLALAPERRWPGRPATSTARSSWPSRPSRSVSRPAIPTSTRSALSELGALKIATGATSDGFCAHGGGVDRRRQRRAVPVHDRRDDLLADRRLPRPDRLRAGERMDRGRRA